jgi:conjugal transfer/entry exclusion protein
VRKRMIMMGLLALTVQNPERVEAGAFASEVTQLLNHAQLVMQYIRQGTQVANELNMYADMLVAAGEGAILAEWSGPGP